MNAPFIKLLHSIAGSASRNLASEPTSAEPGLQDSKTLRVLLRDLRSLRAFVAHGRAKIYTFDVWLGFSSGVRRFVDPATSDPPVGTAMYCFPSTAYEIG